MRARSVTMRFLVSAGFEFRDMRLHRVVGQLQLNAIVARATLFTFAERQLARVRHKAAVPRIDAAGLLAFRGGGILVMNFVLSAAEEIRLAVVAIAKRIIIVEDKIETVEEIDHYGRVCHDQKARRRAAAIDVLAPDVQRWSQHAARLPANRLLALTAGIPDYALAFAVENVEHFLEKITLWFRLRAGRQLAEISDVNPFATNYVDVSAIYSCSKSLPGLNFGLAQIGDVVVLVNRKILLFEPLLPGIYVSLIPGATLRIRDASLFAIMIVMVMTVSLCMMDVARMTLRLRFGAQNRSRRKQTQPAGRRALNKFTARDVSAQETLYPISYLFHLLRSFADAFAASLSCLLRRHPKFNAVLP